MKFERTQIHFLSDVFVAVASLDLKVPIISKSLVPRVFFLLVRGTKGAKNP